MPDIARDPAFLKRRRRRRIGYGIIAGIVVVGVSIALARMEPAAPDVERGILLFDKVKRGSLVRQVRGLGTLVPEDTRWIPSQTEGRVERILLRPGARVEPNSVIVELSSPQVEQDAIRARLDLQSSEAALFNLRAQLQSELLREQSATATLQSEYQQARMQADADEALAKEKLVSDITRRQSALRAETLAKRIQIEEQRVTQVRDSNEARLRVQQAALDTMRAAAGLAEDRLRSLKVTPGFSGVLQVVQVEVGQRVAPGANLARVADPDRLKAELRINETQAKDIEIGQSAEIDTRTAVIAGRVTRKDPAATNGTVTVDVSLTDALPRGAVPDMSVDGTIQLERMENILYVGRPSLGQDQSTIGLFRADGTGHARRVQVKLGRSSATAIEVVSGLTEGDEVVLSDMSSYDSFDRVRLR